MDENEVVALQSGTPLAEFLTRRMDEVGIASLYSLSRMSSLNYQHLLEFVGGTRHYSAQSYSREYLAHACRVEMSEIDEIWLEQHEAVALAIVGRARQVVAEQPVGDAFTEIFALQRNAKCLSMQSVLASSTIKYHTMVGILRSGTYQTPRQYSDLLTALDIDKGLADLGLSVESDLKRALAVKEAELREIARREEQEREDEFGEYERDDEYEDEQLASAPASTWFPSPRPQGPFTVPVGWAMQHYVAEGGSAKEVEPYLDYHIQEISRDGCVVLDIRYSVAASEGDVTVIGYVIYAAPAGYYEEVERPSGY